MALIQVRVDDALKRDAEALFKDFGLDVPSAVRLFIKQSLIQNRIPFMITGPDKFYNEFNLQVLEKSINQLEQGKTVIKSMEETE